MRLTSPRAVWPLAFVAVVGAFASAVVLADTSDPASPAPPSSGTIRGRVRFAGQVPPPAPVHVHADGDVCGKGGPMLDESLLVAADGALANAVIVLQGVPAEAAAPTAATATLDQRNCTFVPHVQAVTQGTTLAIQSTDPVLHNVHAFLGKRTAFNLAMPLPNRVVQRTLDQPGILRIRCDSGHTWMGAYIAVVPHRFHATSIVDGTFAIPAVPPGTYTLRAWHERLGAVEQRVEVTAGGEAEVSLTFKELESDKPTPPAEDPGLRDALQETRTALEALDDRRRADTRAQLAREGRPVFVKFCGTCHGARGDGTGPSARFTSTPPRDFTRGTYKFRMTPAGSPPSFDDLVRTISVGVRGTHMPAWKGKLSRTQIEILARYLTTLSDVFWTDTPLPPPLDIPAETPYDLASVDRGKALFTKMSCVTCHGAGGAGDGVAAAALKDDWGHPIRPADFTRGAFKGGCCGAAVYRAISTGLAGTPMPTFGGAMTPAERWDLVHYVMSLGRKHPAADYMLRAPAGRITPP